MYHRNIGETTNCFGCKYWSERIAKSDETTNGQVAAMCLNKLSVNHMKYTIGFQKCDDYVGGYPIDMESCNSD